MKLMEPLTTMPSRRVRLVRPLFIIVIALSLLLAGCSGGEESGGSGGSSESGDSGSSGSSPETTQTTPATGQTSAEETTAAPERTREPAPGPSRETTSDPGGSTALSGGLEAARSEAESWNEDAELYAIASLRPTVNAEGKSQGWLYSFVSESTGSVISIPYRGGEVRGAQGQGLPEGQVALIAEDTIPASEMIDSPEAIQRSEEVRSFLEENPQTGASVSVDAASEEEPQWILQVPQAQLQELIPATE